MSDKYKVPGLGEEIENRTHKSEEREGKSSILECGNLKLNLNNLEVTIAEEIIPISVLEFSLLLYFVQNQDRLLTREQILKAVWRDTVVSFRTVDTHMVSLRKKLSKFDHGFTTVYAGGYLLKRNPAISESRPSGTVEKLDQAL